MAWFLYYPMMYLMVAGIRLSSLWSEKSKQWIDGRRNWQDKILSLPPKKHLRIWFHVSSLGEFEQARPVMELLKKKNPAIDIILTFFSPSGFNHQSSYPLATALYLPADLPGNAAKWLNAIQPDAAVFVKYDLWPGYLKALQLKHIPTMLISAHWTPGKWFSSRNTPPTRSLIRNFKQIFLQQKDILPYFKSRGFDNLSFAGDTRIDRSLELPGETIARIPAVVRESGPFDMVAGSTWPKDEDILIPTIESLNLRAIIAPHDVSPENIDRLMKSIPVPAIRLSGLSVPDTTTQVIVVDSIGLLSVLYSLGTIAYVGGGFGAGIHNTLEPMAHRKPVVFGPVYRKFPEALKMVEIGAAFPVKNAEELRNAINQLQEDTFCEEAGKKAFDYLQENRGASDKVALYILEAIPYTAKI